MAGEYGFRARRPYPLKATQSRIQQHEAQAFGEGMPRLQRAERLLADQGTTRQASQRWQRSSSDGSARIVFTIVSDPVGGGLVNTLAYHGGNITGDIRDGCRSGGQVGFGHGNGESLTVQGDAYAKCYFEMLERRPLDEALADAINRRRNFADGDPSLVPIPTVPPWS